MTEVYLLPTAYTTPDPSLGGDRASVVTPGAILDLKPDGATWGGGIPSGTQFCTLNNDSSATEPDEVCSSVIYKGWGRALQVDNGGGPDGGDEPTTADENGTAYSALTLKVYGRTQNGMSLHRFFHVDYSFDEGATWTSIISTSTVQDFRSTPKTGVLTDLGDIANLWIRCSIRVGSAFHDPATGDAEVYIIQIVATVKEDIQLI